MIKLIERDKKIRKNISEFEKKRFVLKIISQNQNFFSLIRWKAKSKLNILPSKSSKTYLSNLCILTTNKKKFNKLTNFSRIVFLKLINKKKICNIYKSSW
uniref:Small ribosomal subunit protein uS14m n=1 Tax=Pleurosigma intermedium TaxID=197753 RepID=A0A8F9R3K8_9STRA|nr:ribosomal protein S14 [Pleurosigma sp. mgcode 4]